MIPGAIVLAHNSHNAAKRLEHYLAFVRDRKNFTQSVNILFDGEGLRDDLFGIEIAHEDIQPARAERAAVGAADLR